MAEEKEHPLRIGSTYANQFSRPEDGIRDREEAERKAELRELADEGTVPHEASEEYAEAWNEEIAKYATEETDEPSMAEKFNSAFASAVADAGARVTEAQLTPDQRLAREIARELRAVQDDEPDPDSPEWYARQAAEEARLLAELEEEEDEPAAIDVEEDEYLGVDAEGRSVYQNAAGVQYLAED